MTPRLVRVRLGGDALAGFGPADPAASVRLLLPEAGARGALVVPRWTGNEFLLPDGRRPTLRTLTLRRFDADALELVVEIVVHGSGAAARWASEAEPGDRVALSGPAAGFRPAADAAHYVLAGDETALPAVSTLLEVIPADKAVTVVIELARPDGEAPLPVRPGWVVHWPVVSPGAAPGDAVVAALRRVPLDPGTWVWVAGEAAAMQRVRRLLFGERGLPRARGTVRGYWKHGRAASADPADLG